MNSKNKAILYVLFMLLGQLLISQSTYQYSLNPSNIHFSPIPALVGGVHPSTNYNLVTKPLICETFCLNTQCGINANTIHVGAGNVPNVFFGGDINTSIGSGQQAIPVFTNQTFNKSDFPVYLEAIFYSESNLAEYNESYIFIVPSNYQYFCSPTYYFNIGVTAPREGLFFGGTPYEDWVVNNNSATQATVTLSNSVHNLASNGSWFKLEGVFDTLPSGDLILRDIMIDNQFVYSGYANFNSISWKNDFRVGFAADDLIRSFIIKTNYNPIKVDFSISDTSICVNDCVDFNNLSKTQTYNPTNQYKWTFNGATPNSSLAENPNNICYPSQGTFPIELIVVNQFETDTIIKYITVNSCDTILPLEPCGDLEFEMPNVFSPNNDRVNDYFVPLEYNCYRLNKFIVYNRWGQIVHESNQEIKWDGRFSNKNCSDGVYYWIVEHFDDKNIMTQEKGFFHLFR